MGLERTDFDAKVDELCDLMFRYASNTAIIHWRDEIRENLEHWYDWVVLDNGTTTRDHELVAWSRRYTITVVLDRDNEQQMWADFLAGVDRIHARASDWAYGEVGYSLHKLDDIVDMRPEEYAAAAAALQTVVDALTRKTRTTLTALGDFHGWEGLAARNYYENFFKVVPETIANHAWLTRTLIDATLAAKAVVDLGQQSAMNLVSSACQTAKDALDAQADENTIDPAEVLIAAHKVVGILGEIVPLLPTDLTGAKEVAKWLGSATGSEYTKYLGLAEKYAQDLDKHHLQAPDPDSLLASIDETVTEIIDGNWNGWHHIESTHTYLAYQRLDGPVTMFPAVPDIAHGNVPPGDFHHDSSDQYE
jgi:hypothetical protein